MLATLATVVTAALVLVGQPSTASAAPDDARCRPGAGAARACGSVLTVTVSGAGTVTAPGDPAISCREVPPPRAHRAMPSTCSSTYGGGAVVLTATADDDHRFLEWTGCGTVDGNRCTVTMTQDRSVTATFVVDTRVVGVQVQGGGTVVSDPEGIECRAGDDQQRARGKKTSCYGDFLRGAEVTLTAVPDAGQRFTGWTAPVLLRSGGRDAPEPACSGAAPSCTFTVTGDPRARATFAPATPTVSNTLRVSTAGAGTGTVTSDGAGIDCGADCWEAYDQGTVVTLTARPAAGSEFAGFWGCSGKPCAVTMDKARHVTATFTVPAPADTSAPDTLITSVPRFPANDHSQFRFASTEEGSTFQCSMDGGARADCVSGVDFPCLAPGRHTFSVWATDPAGNADPTAASHRFRVHANGGCPPR
ncbi:hypothetical protein GCM10009606_49600 [Nocardioides aquiterrae]|uniref:Bacterial repeat domain-containing protein n=1 Tax=Nocardioides aquiterrae TaxID=203799 RepID=A0ABP4FCF5_9ACTN